MDNDDRIMFVSSVRALYPGMTFDIGVDAVVGRCGCRCERRLEEVVDQTQTWIVDIAAVPVKISASAADGLENSLP